MRRAIAVLVVIALTGCSPPEELFTDAGHDAEGKQFRPPGPGRAALYVVAPRYGVSDFTVGQRSLGPVADGGWFRVDVRPGAYTLRCKSPVTHDPGARLDIDLQAGRIAYVSTGYIPLGAPACRVTLEDVSTGQAQIRAARRLRSIADPND